MFYSKKSNNILLTVLFIMTLVATCIGATFAYFTARVRNDATNQTIIIRTANIGTINYVNGNELRLDNEVKFTVSADANANVPATYTLSWVDVVNNFTDTNNLVYTLVGTTNGSGQLVTNQTDKSAPTTADNVIIGSGKVKPGETHEYTLQVSFLENGTTQNDDQGKSFSGKIIVKTSDDEETYYTDEAKEGTTTKPTAN